MDPNCNFPKGIIPGFCQKIEFFCGLFWEKSTHTSLFSGILRSKKIHFRQKKNRSFNFPKGLVHGSCRKMELFVISVYVKYDRFWISWIEKNDF